MQSRVSGPKAPLTWFSCRRIILFFDLDQVVKQSEKTQPQSKLTVGCSLYPTRDYQDWTSVWPVRQLAHSLLSSYDRERIEIRLSRGRGLNGGLLVDMNDYVLLELSPCPSYQDAFDIASAFVCNSLAYLERPHYLATMGVSENCPASTPLTPWCDGKIGKKYCVTVLQDIAGLPLYPDWKHGLRVAQFIGKAQSSRGRSSRCYYMLEYRNPK